MKIKQYPSGLRLVVNTKNDLNIVSFKIYVNAGARNESKDEYGLAHFLEHMFFKSTPNYNYQEISALFDGLGTKINAFTGTHNTCYFFKSLKNVFESSLKIFSEMFFNTTYDLREMTNEKKVVIEEYKMSKDDVQRSCIINAFKSLYEGSELDRDIIGTPKTIRSFKVEDLKRFKSRNYLPQNIVISVSGKIKLKEMERLLKKYFAPLLEGNFDGNYELASFVNVKPKNKFISKNKDNEQTFVYVLTELGKKTNKQMYAFDLLFAILGYGMSSKFFTTIRSEKGLVYNIDAGTQTIGTNNLAEISFSTSNDKVCEALTSILSIIKDCANGNISLDELEKSKNKYIAGLVYSKETNSDVSGINGASLINENKIEMQKQIESDVRAISLEQIITCAKEFYAQENYVVSCIGKCQKSNLYCYNHWQ